MKKIITIIFMICAFLMNIYLIFYWNPNDLKITSKKNNESVSVLSRSKSIYTVNKENVMYVISDEEKQELKRIVNNLSTVDIGKLEGKLKLKEELKSEDENKAIIEAFKIFKTRLSSADYKKVRSIFSKFIDMEYLDSNLAKI